MLLKWIAKTITPVALLILPVLLAACSPNLQIQSPAPLAKGYTLSGTVMRDQPYSQNLAPALTFQLVPLQEGWEIWVGDPTLSTGAEYNFAMPVTPPFAGINARALQGWHFRNSDNSGPNEAGEKNVNAPQEVRPFCFVSNREDFRRALDAMSTGLPAIADAIATNALPIHSGTFTITNYTLGNLAGQEAWFEQMDFTVTLSLDDTCTLFS